MQFLLKCFPVSEFLKSLSDMYKGHMDKTKEKYDQGWEVGVAWVGGVLRAEMETTVLKQQLKN